jgi:hypothetical protein
MLSDFPSRARYLAAHDYESLPYSFLRNQDDIPWKFLTGVSEEVLLRKFGMGTAWKFAKPIVTFGFILGTLCTFAGLVVWIWKVEERLLAIISTIVFFVTMGLTGIALFKTLFTH